MTKDSIIAITIILLTFGLTVFLIYDSNKRIELERQLTISSLQQCQNALKRLRKNKEPFYVYNKDQIDQLIFEYQQAIERLEGKKLTRIED